MPYLFLQRSVWLIASGVGLYGIPLPSHAQWGDWNVQVTPFNQVFPALDLSQAPRADERGGDRSKRTNVIGTGNGLIALQLHAHHDGEHVRLAITASQWLNKPAQLDAVLTRAGQDYELHPALEWNTQRLDAQPQATPVTLQFSLSRDGNAAGERTIAIDLRPLNDALYFVRDGHDSVDLSWIFAAFVNENDLVVDRILDSARQSGIVEKFTGYSAADADAADDINVDEQTRDDAVLRQVWAIWHALSLRGIRYSGADPGIDRGPRVFSQRVRFLADIWQDRSANCIDGSVLIASALQRIGLRSFLVLVPGHAFIGFYSDAAAEHAVYLETTLLGSALSMPPNRPAYARALYLAPREQSSLASFDAALHAGAARQARSVGKLDGQHRPDYVIIDIAAARRFGIQPIAIPVADEVGSTR